MRALPLCVCVMGLFVVGMSGCDDSENLSARNLANALAEEFDEWLEFENGQVEEGDPPVGFPDMGLPQVDSIDSSTPLTIGDEAGGPRSIPYGQWFEVVLNVQGDAMQVTSAVVHVEQANTDSLAKDFIRVTPPSQIRQGPMGQVVLRARINHLEGLAGNAFSLRIALATASGLGDYGKWNLITFPQAGEISKVAMCACESGIEPGVCMPDDSLRNIHLVFEEQCNNQGLIDHYSGAICDNPDMVANACFLWGQAFGPDPVDAESMAVPDGTRLESDWGQEGQFCTFEIECLE